MKGKLKTLVAASFALLFGSAAAAGPLCPPGAPCDDQLAACLERIGPDDPYCWEQHHICAQTWCSGGAPA